MDKTNIKGQVWHLVQWVLALSLPLAAVWFTFHFIIGIYTVRIENFCGGFSKGTSLYIDKWTVGARHPFTPLRVPFTTYAVSNFSLPYRRMKPLQIERFDVIAFNCVKPKDIAPDLRPLQMGRVIGLPGETIQLINGKIYVDGLRLPATGKEIYTFEASFSDSLDATFPDHVYPVTNRVSLESNNTSSKLRFHALQKDALQLAGDSLCTDFDRMVEYLPNKLVYPNGKTDQNPDNYGAVEIPYAGLKCDSTSAFAENHYLDFEKSKFLRRDRNQEGVFLNDYYFLLADYRRLGNDSRFFGAVPAYLIAGKIATIAWP